MRDRKNVLNSHGFTLLEMMLAVAMMAIVVVGIASIVNRQSDQAKANVVALQLKTIGEAAGEYIKDAQSTLLQNTQVANSKVIITLPMLQAAGYLNTGFNVTNGYQQNTCVVVRRAPNPTNNPQLGNDLLGLVVTQGGNAVDDVTLGQISATIGSGGGAVYAQNTAQVTGALGGWNFDKTLFEGATVAGLNNLPGGAQALPAGQNCSGVGNVALSVGHPTVSLWFSNGASRSASGMLYRNAVAGQPELNTMNTALLTAGPAIIPDDQIGQACNTGSTPDVLGAIATAQDGSVVSCVNNIWVKTDKYWGAAVDVLSDLGTCDASKAGETRMVKSTTGTAFDTHPYVPYACDGTGTWKAVGIEQNGNFRVAGGFEVDGAAQLHNNIHVGGNADFDGALEVDNSTVLHNSLHVGGHAGFDGDLSLTGASSGVLNLKSFMTFQNQSLPSAEGTGCNDVGNGKGVTMTTQGKILSCQSGIWRSIGPTTVNNNNTYPTYNYNSGTLACTTVSQHVGSVGGSVSCPSGYTVTGGGASCDNAVKSYLHNSGPTGNGWVADCFGKDDSDSGLTVYAKCCKIN